MEEVAFVLLVTGTVLVFMSGILQPRGYIQPPFLVSAVFLGWVIPQTWIVRKRFLGLEEWSLTLLDAFLLVCLLALVAGWQWGLNSNKGYRVVEKISSQNLVKISLYFTLISWAMTLGMGSASLEERASTAWSGSLTIMYFFSNLKLIAFFLSLYLFLKRPNKTVTVLLVANILLYFPAIFLYFRRRAMLEVYVAITLALWFAKRVTVPKILILSVVVFAPLIVFSVGALRHLAEVQSGEAKWISLQDFLSVDLWAATPFEKESNAPEITHAFNIIRLIASGHEHTIGAASWNRVVFQWVPAQLIGADLKNGLMFNVDPLTAIEETFNENRRLGATTTAMGEAYLEFGFLGFTFFVFSGYFCGLWWERSRRGDRLAMTYYCAGLSAITLMPTAYAIYFFNSIALHVGATSLVASFLYRGFRSSRLSRYENHLVRTNRDS